MVQTRAMKMGAGSSAAEKDSKYQEQKRKPLSQKMKKQRKPCSQKKNKGHKHKTTVSEAEKRELLKEMLRERIEGTEWIGSMMDRCRALLNEKGIHDLTLDMLVDEISPLAGASVPGSVEEELSQKIEAFIASKPEPRGGSTSNPIRIP